MTRDVNLLGEIRHPCFSALSPTVKMNFLIMVSYLEERNSGIINLLLVSLCVGFVTIYTGSIKAAAILSYKAHLCRVRAVKPVFKKIKEKVLVNFHIKKRPTRINLTGTTPGRNIYILQEKISLLEKMNLYQNAYFGGVYSDSDEQWFVFPLPLEAPGTHSSLRLRYWQNLHSKHRGSHRGPSL